MTVQSVQSVQSVKYNLVSDIVWRITAALRTMG